MKKIFYFILSFLLLRADNVFAETTSVYTTESLKNKATTNLNPGNIWNTEDLLSRGINAMVMFMGSIALILIVYAGFLWMTAGGNDSRISKARTIMIWTLLGTVAIGASYVFVKFVINIFG